MVFRPVKKSDINDYPARFDRIHRGQWVGRENELEKAKILWQRAVSGQGQVLLVSGEPGVGKTRFVQELASAANLAGARVMTGECFSEGSAPYAPLSQMIYGVFDASNQTGLSLPDETLRDLLPIIPSLHTRLADILPNQNLDPRAEQQRVFEGFIAFCSTLSLQAPLLLFVDDVHWADLETLYLLRNLARRGRKLSLMIVLTFREAELAYTPALNEVLVELNRERLAVQFRLERLSHQETGDLLTAFFAEEVTSDFLDAIYHQTEGNPFFIEEVCKGLIEAGQLSYSDGRWHRPSMAEVKIPQTVRAAIQARLAKLPASAQETLRMAAILGRDFDFETLKYACDLDEETLIDALESALRAQLIDEAQHGESGRTRFSFVHVLIPTTLRESIIHVRRQKLHLRAVQAIQAVHPEDFEALAYQYAEAGDGERARQYYLRAGERAQSAAPGEAARFYRAALDRWTSDDDQAARAEVLARLAYCLWIVDNAQGSLEAYEMAYNLFNALGNRLQSGEMQRMIGRMYWQQANRAAALEHYYRALSILEQEPDSVELARAIDSISQVYMLAHDSVKAIQWGKRAIQMAETLGAEGVVVSALNNIGTNQAQNGDVEAGISILQESIRRAIAAGLPQDASRAYYNTGVMYQRQCNYKKAEEVMKELYTYSLQVYTKTYTILALWRLVWIKWYTGEWEAALSYRSQLVEFGETLYSIWAKRLLGMIDLDMGYSDEALRELEESLPDALRADEFQTTAPHWEQLIRAYATLGQDAKMMDAVHRLLEFVSARNYPSTEAVMALLNACGLAAERGGPEAMHIAHTCLAHLERHAQQYKTGEAGVALAEGRGRVYLAENKPRQAVSQLRQAAAEWGAISRYYDQARVLGYLRRALLSLGETVEAEAVQQQASSIVDSLAAQLDADHRTSFLASPMVREILQDGEDLSKKMRLKATGRSASLLTGREVEVLKLVAQGLTNAQIAERLTLSPLTVNAHLRSIFNKLDVTTRTAAVRQAMDLGLV